ncbi:MAG: hypothetical protein ACYDIA_10975 [Candidatus Humimicrobiaceae bacterium]
MGADFIVLGDDYGMTSGPIFSPKSFEKLLLPGFIEIVNGIKNAGGFVIKHYVKILRVEVCILCGF